MNERRLLDLFCGEGLASCGYWLSGRFSEIVGVDINPKMSGSYSFDFINADCMKLDYDFLMSFDFIHASPPCQSYSYALRGETKSMRLIPGVKLMLAATGVPHVIENVQGAMFELKPNFSCDGHFFGLPMERRRYFYISSLPGTHQKTCKGRETISPHGHKYCDRLSLIRAFGLEIISGQQLSKITRKGIEQGIPPIITKYIADSFCGEKIQIA